MMGDAIRAAPCGRNANTGLSNSDSSAMHPGSPAFLKKWRAWSALPVHERGAFLRLMLALSLVHLGLRVAGYARIRTWCERWANRVPRRAVMPDDLAAAKRLAELAEIAGRHSLVTATCLRQALVVSTLLQRRGLDARLQIGVQHTGERFGAHAWVDLDGVALGQPLNNSFSPSSQRRG